MSIQVGSKAPSWKAQAYIAGEMKEISSEDFAGKWMVLFFYPMDFTFVCPTELRGFAEREEQFKALGAQVIGASTDSIYSHQAWFSRDLPEVKYPVLADITKRIARDFGILLEEKGIALRGTFIIDPEGVLRYVVVSDLSVGRSVDETLRTLEALQTGQNCPVNWKKGDKFV